MELWWEEMQGNVAAIVNIGAREVCRRFHCPEYLLSHRTRNRRHGSNKMFISQG